MSTVPITTPQQKIRMLKDLVAGRDLAFVSDVTGFTREESLNIVSGYGYPDKNRMQWAIDTLIENGDKIPERVADLSHRPKVLLDEPTKPYQSAPSGMVNTPPAVPVGQFNDLLHQGRRFEHARTRNLAAKIHVLVGDLTARLTDEHNAAEAKAQEAKKSAATAARIAELQAEIDKLKGKKTKPAVVKGPRSERLTKGEHPCPKCGRVFDTPQGASTHRRRAHEGFNPHAVAS